MYINELSAWRNRGIVDSSNEQTESNHHENDCSINNLYSKRKFIDVGNYIPTILYSGRLLSYPTDGVVIDSLALSFIN